MTRVTSGPGGALVGAMLALTLIVPAADAQRTRERTRERERTEERDRDADRDSDRERDDRSFRWQGALEDGSWLRIKNLNGSISVEAAEGDRVDVQATKSWKKGNPEDVRVEVQRDGDNVTICALWYERSSCDADSYQIRGNNGRGNNNNNNDVQVQFTVRLPRGVRLNAQTVNGSVEIEGARSEVVAKTVNGRIEANSSSGPVTAETVNGGIHVRMSSLSGRVSRVEEDDRGDRADRGDRVRAARGDRGERSDLRFKTVNGSVTVELPERVDADIEMSTVNGSLRTDFPITINGRLNPRHLRATLGDGGRRIELATVNGSIELRRLGARDDDRDR